MTGFAGTTLSRQQWAELIVEEAHELGYTITPRQLAEGVGVREAEGFTSTGTHIGPWEEEESFGSTADRLNYRTSTRSALERWHADGKSWWPGWGEWEKGETEGAGPDRYKKHLALATAVLGKHHLTRRRSPTSNRRSQSKEAGSSGESEGGAIGGDVLHFAVVALLVVGGLVMIAMGVTRTFGPARRAS